MQDDSDDEFLRRLKQLHEAHEESKAMIQVALTVSSWPCTLALLFI